MPAFQFYPGDWLRDPELSRCSKAARGVWIDMLCRMFDCDSRGVLATGGVAWSDQEVAESIGGDSGTNLSHIQELLLKKVARRNDAGAIYSKRMVRDEQERTNTNQRVKKHRSNGDVTHLVTPVVTVPVTEMKQPSSSSTSSSTSKQKQKPGTALAMPDPRHSEISVHIQSLYTKATTVYPAPWGKGEAGALALLLKSNPSWTAAHIKRLVDNRFSSEENHADPPRLWITRLPAYAQPLDRYGKPIQKANGAAIGMDREITPESRDLTARQLAANIEWLRKKKADGKTLNEFEERMLQEHSHA